MGVEAKRVDDELTEKTTRYHNDRRFTSFLDDLSRGNERSERHRREPSSDFSLLPVVALKDRQQFHLGSTVAGQRA